MSKIGKSAEKVNQWLSRTIDRRRRWHPTPILLPGKSHGRRSLVGCSLWGRWGSDTTKRLHFRFSLSCIGKGNGNPLQCSCLENPRDRGAWWAAVYGVAQSQTRLKWLSSSSSRTVDGWENGNWLLVCMGFFSGVVKFFWNWLWWWLNNSVNISYTFSIYFAWEILWYVNYLRKVTI